MNRRFLRFLSRYKNLIFYAIYYNQTATWMACAGKSKNTLSTVRNEIDVVGRKKIVLKTV